MLCEILLENSCLYQICYNYADTGPVTAKMTCKGHSMVSVDTVYTSFYYSSLVAVLNDAPFLR